MAKIGLACDLKDRPGAIKFVARSGRRHQQRDRIFSIELSFSDAYTQLLDAARRKVSGMVSSISKEIKPNLLKSQTRRGKRPVLGRFPLIQRLNCSSGLSQRPSKMAVRFFEQANDPQTQAELIQLVPAPVLKHLGLVA